jgi:uridine kinase
MDTNTEKQGDLILLRGIPGSGKTTFANVILQQPNNNPQEILSADDFFEDENGFTTFSKLLNHCLRTPFLHIATKTWKYFVFKIICSLACIL